MKVARQSYAVFWSRPGWRVQFHADMKQALYPSAKLAAEAFRRLFPQDRVYSVRDASGRFLPFKT